MASVCNDFSAHLRIHENELSHAALHGNIEPLAHGWDGTHGAPKVIHMPHACVKGSLHFRPTRIGMAACYQTAMFPSDAIELVAAG